MRIFAVGTKILGGGLANIWGVCAPPRSQCRTAPVYFAHPAGTYNVVIGTVL